MATVLTDLFNSYTDGNLNSQGSWTADTAFQVEGTVVKEGAKAVSASITNANDHEATKAGTATADGVQTFYVRANNTDYNYIDVSLKSGSNYRFRTYFIGTNIQYRTSDGFTTIKSGCVVDTWYAVQIEWRSSDGKARFRVNTETWTDWITCYSSGDPDTVYMNMVGSGGSFTGYVDTFQEGFAPTDYIMSVNTGNFILSGINTILGKGITMIVNTGSYILNGINVIFNKKGWIMPDKHNSSITQPNKHSASITQPSKHTSNWVEKTKH